MHTFLRDIKDIEVLIALSPEDIAPIVLQTAKREEQNGLMHVQSLVNNLYQPGREHTFPNNRRREVEQVIGEGWSWLRGKGLIVEDPGYNGRNGFMILTRAGIEFLNSPDRSAHLKSLSDFPKALLHPSIVDEVWAALLRGDFNDAVFKAFRTVEEAVRSAGRYTADDLGISLMRRAFDKTAGPLTNLTHPEGERDALAHLFAGAIGSYKNPHSHRTVTINELSDAQDMVLLASHLLRIVDARR